eukprot:TRINITY_DN4814_c0_g1_i2.p1 TRINITY_DN4814_c0_g1~~TRINITY_DN4814_c0_g1_i2.p1  ORF type:complete len:162 (-),score=46.56 TRINITY_DN4814_c0_g1_i2:61-501(-)
MEAYGMSSAAEAAAVALAEPVPTTTLTEHGILPAEDSETSSPNPLAKKPRGRPKAAVGATQQQSPADRALRRRQRNREAAKAFRQRQRAYTTELEQQVAALTAANAELQAKWYFLFSEHQLVQEQLTSLRAFIASLFPLGSAPQQQ